jgi:glycosyltransferase involved in cell wall biosynthesis
MTKPVVAIIHLGIPTANGERVRVAGWIRTVEEIGGRVEPVPLLSDHRPKGRYSMRVLPALVRGRAVPEAATWSLASVLRRLDQIRPDAIVCMTSRAYQPGLRAGPWVTVLDHVDQLGVSYQGRSRIARSWSRRLAYRTLAVTARRFERSSPSLELRQVAAGWSDARALGVTWLPIVVELQALRPEPAGPEAVDVCFVGTLSYPPNVEAVRLLAQAWPEIRRARPSTSAIVAGANPIGLVVGLARANGWELVANFGDVADIYRRTRVAVSPLRTASGIQIKVLDAAAHGVPQVISPAAMAGLEPGFPALLAETPAALADAVNRLLADVDGRLALAKAAAIAIEQRYVASAWALTAADLLAPDGACD